MNAYQVLGIEHGADEQAIKRAYSRLIKQYRPDTHPIEFADIRHAYEEAMNWLRTRQSGEVSQQVAETDSTQEETTAPAKETDSTQRQPVRQTEAIKLNVVQELVAEFAQGAAEASESEMLAKYRDQAESLQSLTLDQQMEYEHVLLYWFLNVGAPPLLAFRAVNERYGWLQSRIAIERTFGGYAGKRLEALQRLSTIYSNILGKQNSLVRVELEQPAPRKWLISHYEDSLAQELDSLWRRECRDADFESLNSKLSYTSPLPQQVYWVDIALGIVVTAGGLLITSKNAGWESWLKLILLGTSFMVLPATLRVIEHWASAKLMRFKFGADFLSYAIIRILMLGGLVILLGMIYPPAMNTVVVLLVAYYSWSWFYEVISYIEGVIIRSSKKIYAKISGSRKKQAQHEPVGYTYTWLGFAAMALYAGLMFLGVYLSK